MSASPANDNPVEDSTLRVAVIGTGKRFETVAAKLAADPALTVTIGSTAPLADPDLKMERSIGQAVGVAPVTVVVANDTEELHALLFGRGAAAVSGPLNALFVDLSDVPPEVTGLCSQRVGVLRKRYVSAARVDLAALAAEDRFADSAEVLARLGAMDAKRAERSLTA